MLKPAAPTTLRSSAMTDASLRSSRDFSSSASERGSSSDSVRKAASSTGRHLSRSAVLQVVRPRSTERRGHRPVRQNPLAAECSTDDATFLRPTSPAVPRSAALTLKKSSSYQNLKLGGTVKSHGKSSIHAYSRNALAQVPLSPHHSSSTDVASIRSTKSPFSKKLVNAQKATVLKTGAASTSTLPLSALLREPNQTQRDADRISVNTDLLSRVEKEKKVYEARISELTQLTENRKIEIEKLSFEIRNLKHDKEQSEQMSKHVHAEVTSLRLQLEELGEDVKQSPFITAACTIPDHPCKEGGDYLNSSPPESLATTNQLTPCFGTTTAPSINFAHPGFGSVSSDWNDSTKETERSISDDRAFNVLSLCTSGSRTAELLSCGVSELRRLELPHLATAQGGSAATSVANLEGRIQQMEEDNYTTTEELQATMQELCDLQRTLDEAYEENRGLAFERAILLESLCSQTAKLEHCRLQVDHLKQLLLTSVDAVNPDAREARFCDLYASVDEEKQVLLTQNNELAQSSDGLARECHQLTEKATILQDSYDDLVQQHGELTATYQQTLIELNMFKSVNLESSEVDGLADTDGGSSGNSAALIRIQSDMDQRMDQLLTELANAKEEVALANAEHEREATEWRLYERDLLKTVQVADGIKTESEEEMQRLATENHCLRDQVKQISDESTRLRTELKRVQLQLSSAMAECVATGELISTPSSSASKSNGTHFKTALVSISPPTNSVGLRRSSLTNTGFTPTPYLSGLQHRTQYRPSVGNGRGIARGGSALPTGPTVRSLIHSIESQVKVVQQQKLNICVSTTPTPPSAAPQSVHKLRISGPASSLSLKQPILEQPRVHSASVSPTTSTSKSLDNTLSGRNNESALTGGSKALRHREAIASAPGGPPADCRTSASSTVTATSACSSKVANGASFAPRNYDHQTTSSQPISPSPSRRLCAQSSADVVASGDPIDPASGTASCTSTSSASMSRPSLKRHATVATTSSSNDSVGPPGRFSFSPAPQHSTSGANSNATASSQQNWHRAYQPTVLEEAVSTLLSAAAVVSEKEAAVSEMAGASNPSEVGNNHFQSPVVKLPAGQDLTPAVMTDVGATAPTAIPATSVGDSPPISYSSSATSAIMLTRVDPLQELVKLLNAGSKRNALLRWCQMKVTGYAGVEVNNFSSSWNNGLAFCALLHSYLPDQIPWNELVSPTGLPIDKRRCFELAFSAAEGHGIPTTLRLYDMLTTERPDWNCIMAYITTIYKHFEVDSRPE